MRTTTAVKTIDRWLVAASPILLGIVLLIPVLGVSRHAFWPATVFGLAAVLALASGSRWLRVLAVPFALLSMLQMGYLLYSGHAIDKFFWMAMQATEASEAESFFPALGGTRLTELIVYVLVCIYLLVCFFRSQRRKHTVEMAVGALVCLTAVYTVHPVTTGYDAPSIHGVLRAAYYGRTVRSILVARDFSISPTPPTIVQSVHGPLATQIFVVIGESETRLRMGVYGYSRPTTPLIGKHAFVFRHNVAVGLNTQPNVQVLLTGLLPTPTTGISQTIFSIARAAGYESIVIDNNGYQNDAPIVRISMGADRYISMNGVGKTSAANDDRIRHDQVVLAPLRKAVMRHDKSRTLYVVHLIGSHPSQNLRYPPDFGKFPSYYDNSVLYTDHILARLRRTFVQHAQGPAVMIYLSDHGVGLPPGCGFGPIPDPEHVDYGADDHYYSNYAIPLIVWANQTFRKAHPQAVSALRKNLDKPVDQLFLTPTVADLMGVASVNGTAQRKWSIFAPDANFEPRKTTAGENIDALFRNGGVCVAPSAQTQLPTMDRTPPPTLPR